MASCLEKLTNEINKYATEEDKPILFWFLDICDTYSQWQAFTTCGFVRYGVASYQVHRVWKPTVYLRKLAKGFNEEMTTTEKIGTKKIDEEVCNALRSGSWNGLNFTMPQLDAKLYQKVKKVMEACGGKWNRKAKAIIFADENAKDSMEAAAHSGTYMDLKKAYQQFDTSELTASDLIEKLELPVPEGAKYRFLEPSAGVGTLFRCYMRLIRSIIVNSQWWLSRLTLIVLPNSTTIQRWIRFLLVTFWK